MKAISLWQPWASLIAVGLKTYETRSWSTKHRGPLLICSAKKEPYEDDLILWESKHPLPLGKALCVVDLVDCLPTEEITSSQIVDGDWRYGDFSPGRFAWKLENVRAFKEPFPVRGAQGLFEVDDALIMGREMKEHLR